MVNTQITKQNIKFYPIKEYNFYIVGTPRRLTEERLYEGLELGIKIYATKKGSSKFI